MTLEETIRTVVREEVRAAFADLAPEKKWEGTLKLADAGKLVSVSVSTLEKWGRAGLRIHRKGRVRVVDVGELRAYIANREATAPTAAKTQQEKLLAEVLQMRRVR